MTLLDALLDAVRGAAQFNADYEAAPACILWPDKERLWEGLAGALRRQDGAFHQFGELAPAQRTGPALWLKCVLAGVLGDVPPPPAGAVPILYLPGIGRGDLREVETCPPEWQALVELQYRGAVWAHANGKDWTLAGFLTSGDGGLSLGVARDQRTAVALQQALTKLAETPLDTLRAQTVDADFLLGLLHPDPHREVLRWLDDAGAYVRGLPPDHWKTFLSVCRGTFQFDPERDGPIKAAELLGSHKGAWKEAWTRFKEAPHRYPGIPEWLRRACPAKQMEFRLLEDSPDPGAEAWPQVNEEAERCLREALANLPGQSRESLRQAIATHEARHAPRRHWLWAELGQSPMVRLWEHFAALAQCTRRALAAQDLAAYAAAYEEDGWQADAAVLRALAEPLSEKDRALAATVIRDLYLAWAEESALNFQSLARQEIGVFQVRPSGLPPPGTVILFADALRWDVGQALAGELRKDGLEPSVVGRWSAVPSVTPTAKPAVSPVAHLLGSDLAPEKADVAAFRPVVAAENKALTPDRFRKLLETAGIQFLAPQQTGNPEGLAWTEHGRLDADGHHDGAGIALRCAGHVRILAERVRTLADAGWKHVRVVTDHGWVLVPGGLPRIDLPKFLTDTRWGRCAVLTEGAHTPLPVWPWSWSPAIRMVCAPGIGSFLGGQEYSHGGVSAQECRIPEIHVRGKSTAQKPTARVRGVRWINLRCRVSLEGEYGGLTVDLRLRPADAGSSVVDAARAADANGVASLALVRDDLLGASASVVLFGEDGTVVQRLSLILGEDIP